MPGCLCAVPCNACKSSLGFKLTPDFAPKLCRRCVSDVWPQEKTGKRKFCAQFLIFRSRFFILETSSQQSVKMRAMLCNKVSKSYSRVFFTIRWAGAFRSLRILSGAKTGFSVPPTTNFFEKLVKIL